MGRTSGQKLNVDKARELIKAQGRTREWIATQCGTTTGYLAQVLSGDRSPGRPLLKLLAQTLEVSEEELIEPEGRAS